MKIRRDVVEHEFDFCIAGLGYESRAISAPKKFIEQCKDIYAIGYINHRDKFSYQDNKKWYSNNKATVWEGEDEAVIESVKELLSSIDRPVKCLLDITVMTRHRLATIISLLIDYLPDGSVFTMTYELSNYVDAPNGLSPIRKVCEISEDLDGWVGDLSLPTSLLLGVGYENGKALGIYNYVDAEYNFLFLPKGKDSRFDTEVKKANEGLISSVSERNRYYYDILNPYETYLNLREVVLSVKDYSRPLIVPLGPKVLAALSVLIAKELYPEIPVWRVSSEHMETPVQRDASGTRLMISVEV